MVGQFFIAFSAAAVAVMLALAAIWAIDRRRGWVASTARLDSGIEPIAFLFHDRVLIDATAPARALLHALPGDGDWQRLSAWLSMRLPDSAAQLAELGNEPRLELSESAQGRNLRLLAEDLGHEDLKRDARTMLPRLHGALLKNEQDVALFERLAFMVRRQR